MRNPFEALISAVRRDPGGLVVVWYPDDGLLPRLVAETESALWPRTAFLHTTQLREAFAAPDRVVFLAPEDEVSTVSDLDGLREHLVGRSEPLIIFLLRGGGGAKVVDQSPSLSAWLRGSDVDPDKLAEVDPAAERTAFIAAAGESPEDFLAKWRAEQLPNNARNLGLYYWADLLEGDHA